MVDTKRVIDIIESLQNAKENGYKVAKTAMAQSGNQIPYTPFPEAPQAAPSVVESAAPDNVSLTEEAYFPASGFAVNDTLVPRKPTTTADVWFEPYKDSGVSYAGGLSMPSGQEAVDIMQTLSANNALKEDKKKDEEDVDLSGVQPQRQRRDSKIQALGRAIDAFDFISGVDKNAYMGKTIEKEIEYEKKLAEEDPEGYQADVNRAKILSQRAYESDSIPFKKKCGRCIKKLLPFETQGLDDLTASEFFTSNGKMEIEKLKAANQMSLQRLKGEQALAQLGIKGDNAITLAERQGEIKQALQDSAKMADFARAAYVADKAAEGKVDAANIAADSKNYATDMGYKRAVDVANIGAGSRENVARINANSRENVANINAESKRAVTQMQQEGALERARITRDGALERAKITAAAKGTGNAPQKQSAFEMKVSQDALKKMKQLNESAGRWDSNAYDPSDTSQGYWSRFNVKLMPGADYGIAKSNNTKEAQDYQQFEGLAKQIVQDQLKKIYGAQFAEREGERFFLSMGLSPIADQKVRWDLFMNAINDLRVQNGLAPINPDTFEEESAPMQANGQGSNMIRL